MNRYKAHKRFERFKHVEDLYLKLYENVNNVYEIFLKNPTDKYNLLYFIKFTYRQKYCLI